MILAPDARAGQAFAVNYNDGSGPGSIDVLDATSGALQRVIPVGMFPHALAVDDEHGRAFVANEAAPWRRMGDSLSVVDTCVGREIRRLPLSVPIVTLSIDRTLGRVFIVLQNDRLQIRDAATLRSVRAITPAEGGSRSFLLGVTPSAMVADERNARVVVVGHVAHGAARALALDARSGRILWTATVGPAPLSLAVDGVQARVFVGDSGRAVCTARMSYCRMFSTVSTLDERTGRLLRTASVGQDPNIIVVAEKTRRVFVMNMGNNEGDIGTVSVFDARSGAVLRTTMVGAQPYGAAVDARHNRVFVANGGSGTVSVLDARDGHLRGTWRVVDGPGAVVVDARADRVFVASNDVSNGSPNYYIPVACRGLVGQIGCLGRSLAYAARALRKGRTGTVSMFDARTAP